MKGLCRLLVTAVLAAVLLVSAHQRAQAYGPNGPLDARAGTLVIATGERYFYSSLDGWSREYDTKTFNGVVGKYDNGFRLYNFNFCLSEEGTSGEVEVEKRWWGKKTYWCDGSWIHGYIDPDLFKPIQ